MEPGIEIREIPGDDLVLVLVAEGQEAGRATVRGDVLEDMKTTLGSSRDQVAARLRDTLLDLHEGRLEKVRIEQVVEQPEGSLRFIGRYTSRDYRTVTHGVVWYDVTKSETGPSDASFLVRNKMRFEVHKKLVGDDPQAGALQKVLG